LIEEQLNGVLFLHPGKAISHAKPEMHVHVLLASAGVPSVFESFVQSGLQIPKETLQKKLVKQRQAPAFVGFNPVAYSIEAQFGSHLAQTAFQTKLKSHAHLLLVKLMFLKA